MPVLEFRAGVTRFVVLAGPVAIKLPHPGSWGRFLQGLLANMQERTFAGLWPELCPVRWADRMGVVVVMDRADPVDPTTWSEVMATIPPHVVELCERKPQNYGWLRGRLVGLDYGGATSYVDTKSEAQR